MDVTLLGTKLLLSPFLDILDKNPLYQGLTYVITQSGLKKNTKYEINAKIMWIKEFKISIFPPS